jgi:transposase
MEQSITFVAFDVHKATIVPAIARAGGALVQVLGTVQHTPANVAALLKKLAKDGARLHVCYEAGPFGYGLYRQITALGHHCDVIAPSLIPRKPGERIKTDRRDAKTLATMLRAGLLTDIWVPDEAHEAVRDVVRVRTAAKRRLQRARQQTLSFLLRHARVFPGKKTWTKTHRLWLAAQKFAHAHQHIAFEELLIAIEQGEASLARMDKLLAETVAQWSRKDLVEDLQALRGVSLLTAATLVVEIDDFRRFDNPRDLMGYLGLVPGEHSSGQKRRVGAITKAGNSVARTALVEASWSYRHPPRKGAKILQRQAGRTETVQTIAWKAQVRLCGRYRRLVAAGKPTPKVVTAIARELIGFVWAIARERDAPAVQVQPATA